MQAVAGLFESFDQADQAVMDLQRAGFEGENISILGRDTILRRDEIHDVSVKDVGEGAGVGAVSGGGIGGILGLLVGIGALTIPGIGPVFAAGTLAATIGATVSAAGVGAAIGGILGAMLTLHIPEEEAHIYAEGVKRGAILVVVQAEDARAHEVRDVMQAAGALDVEKVRQQWQESGWTGFEEPDNLD